MSTDLCFVVNEWDTLKKVVVGNATSWGPLPLAEDAIDPKSREHIVAGSGSSLRPCWTDSAARGHARDGRRRNRDDMAEYRLPWLQCNPGYRARRI